jgi:outer membrane protein OmpA-like peptidoglycan-associated protein/cell division septation protein DedD
MSHTLNAFNLNYQIKSQQNTDLYHIIVASYKNEVNALIKINSLKNLGFVDAKIVKIANTNLFRVSLKSFPDKSDANVFLKKNRSTFKSAWILVDSSKNQTTYQPKKPFNSNPTKIAPKPKPKEVNKDQPKTLADKSFNVIIGTYQKEIFAYYQKWELQKRGYNNPKVISDKNKSSYLVSIESFKNKDDAIKLKDSLKNSEYKNSWILVKEDNNKQNKLINELKTQNEDSQIVSNKPKNVSETVSIKNDSIEKVRLTEINSKNSDNVKDEKNSPNPAKNLNVNLNTDIQVEEKNQNKSNNTYTVTNSLNEIDDSGNLNQIKADDLTNSTIQAEENFKSQLSSDQNNSIISEKQNENIERKFELDEKPTPQKSESPKKNSERNIFLANKNYSTNSFDKAQAKFLDLVKRGKESKKILLYLANSYFNNSQYEKAVIWYNKLISKYADELEPEVFYKASLCFKSQGAYELSDTLLEKYIEKTDNIVIKDYFRKNPNYLEKIKQNALPFGITPTIISSENSDFGPSFFGNDKLFFSSTKNSTGNKEFEWSGEPFLDLFVADLDSIGNLSNPQMISGQVNTEYHESSAIVTRDKKKMYFTRNNFTKGKLGKDKYKQVNLKIYSAESDDGKEWSNITELPFNNDNFSCAHPALSLDEKRLYFTSDMPGTFGNSDIWYVDLFDDGEYGEPINLGPQVNTEFRESFPFISESNILYFSSDGWIGLGGFDIYYTSIDQKGFPVMSKNIGEPVNSKLDDFGFIYKDSIDIGYFSSNRKGIWGSKSDEIYKVRRSNCNVYITGVVTDEVTNKPISNTVLKLIDDEGKVVSEKKTDKDGVYKFDDAVNCSNNYEIEVLKEPGYKSNYAKIEIPNNTNKVVKDISLNWIKNCDPYDLICLLNINPILFDLDKYYINSKAAKELKKVYVALMKYPEIKIEISSHTDSRGSNEYNQKLSVKRANETKNWLVKRGIDPSRLITNGYGEFDLENYCNDNIECEEDEHQVNRRSVFKIR